MDIYTILQSVPYTEDSTTQGLFKTLGHIKKTGYLTKDELIQILRWKSPRPLRRYELNSPRAIKEVTTLAFATKNDCLKLHILTALSGVSYPSASAILMFYDPKNFPVLDIRVWKQLYQLKIVTVNARGQGFTLPQCATYLTTIRSLAKEVHTTAREVEKKLFDYDKQKQVGNLYKPYGKN